MRGVYYNLPLDFESLIEKKDAEKVTLETSIRQHIFLLATTALGECKFDETYGTEIWEMDFDLMKSDNMLKELISETLKTSVTRHEKRLILENVEVSINDYNLGTSGKRKMKKKVTLAIKGLILETNRPFAFSNSFFVGPLSY
ncbi:GPW/gp25 family protein [Chryseobacterium aquaticum]|uniref:GPW/gp25 family protein n=1 Tax=Chryseobacterium aquaticum TaxID=452084 RepID=A0A848MZR8_9FLAO|nr:MULTISPECIES: GPW/gp25 family protein [Chryseobacterium]NMR34197.1 GPW/gp25 family protein [Chryseobacterium aquaticum]NRQ46272.1 GPW/gp25 family protein [Chryseobacterium sp. C-204]